MKHYIKIATALIFTVITFCLSGINAFAWNTSDDVIWVQYSDAPEGTAFADLLLKKADGDIYLKESTDTAVELAYSETSDSKDSRFIDIDGSCELAGYDDGYTSCLFRKSFVSQCISENGRTKIVIDKDKTDTNGVFNYYSSFKVAYCDEKGNVLLVTDAVEVKNAKGAVHYDICADGEKISCEIHHAPNMVLGLSMLLFYVAVVLLFGAVVIAGAVVLIVLFIRKRKKRADTAVKSDHR